MPPAGFEPSLLASEWPQTNASDCAPTGRHNNVSATKIQHISKYEKHDQPPCNIRDHKKRLSCGRMWGLNSATTSTEGRWGRHSATTNLLLPPQPVSINNPNKFMFLSASRVPTGLFPIQFLTQNCYVFLSFSTATHIQSILAFYIPSTPKMPDVTNPLFILLFSLVLNRAAINNFLRKGTFFLEGDKKQ